jgi:phosphoribosyl 1,2-cyclic phosphate phosphodiesterase
VPIRTRSALAVLSEETTLIDAGPDIAAQLEREAIEKVDAILITHWHFDHIGGLGEFHEPASIGRWGKIDLFLPAVDVGHFEKELQYLRTTFELRPLEAGQTVEIGAIRYTTVKTNHTPDSVGFLIEGEKRIVYLGDGIRPPEDTMRMVSGADTLILEATMDELDAEGWVNLDIAGAIRIWKELGTPECILTHMSFHNWRRDRLEEGFHHEQRESIMKRHPGLSMAYDGMRLDF